MPNGSRNTFRAIQGSKGGQGGRLGDSMKPTGRFDGSIMFMWLDGRVRSSTWGPCRPKKDSSGKTESFTWMHWPWHLLYLTNRAQSMESRELRRILWQSCPPEGPQFQVIILFTNVRRQRLLIHEKRSMIFCNHCVIILSLVRTPFTANPASDMLSEDKMDRKTFCICWTIS